MGGVWKIIALLGIGLETWMLSRAPIIISWTTVKESLPLVEIRLVWPGQIFLSGVGLKM
jgi:hypothetical protein